MKIVQLLPELNEGGVERGVVELSRELVKLGFESVVISAGGKQAAQIELDGGRHIEFDVCSKNLLTAPWRIRQLRKLLKELKSDILHARSRVPAWLTYLANRNQKTPFVTTVHGFNSVNAYSRVMTFGDRVICVSNAIKDYVQQHYRVPDEKIVVIPRGVDLTAFDPKNLDRDFCEQFSKEHRLEGRFVISSVGRISQLKDFATFIRAIAQVKEQRPDVLGLIVGGVHPSRQAYYRELQDLVAELGLDEYLKFCGSQKQIADIYALSDLIVSSSSKPESFGRSAAEALAMNIPVVATNHGGMTDIVIEGETGALFNVGQSEQLAEKILKCSADDFHGLREKVEERFSLAQMVEKTVAVYNSLV